MTIFWCEDSLYGILTGVYDAWDSRLGHENVRLKTDAQDTLELFCAYRQVHTDEEKAEKVLRTVRKRMGESAWEAICYAAASEQGEKADSIYRIIVLGLSLPNGKEVVNCLQNKDVLQVMRLRQRVWHEAHRMLGFLRFEELGNGVLYARFQSPCAVLPFLAPHFADRYRQEDWIIHDLDRGLLAIHRRNHAWFLTDAAALNLDYVQQYSGQEEDFQKLWKSFCESIAIAERKNPGCQQNLLPLRFRPHMTEFQAEKVFDMSGNS